MSYIMSVNGVEYRIIRLLGKGKGGYSYLAQKDDCKYVLKQIHHEPCDYYQFGDKIQAEIRDYERLKNIGIRIPKMIAVDIEEERILKEYVDGDTIFDMVKNYQMENIFISQVKKMCEVIYQANINIDYFPTNFIPQNGVLYYIDFECNGYMEEWNFKN